MKFLSLGKVLLMMVILASFISCEEEEFFEKDAIAGVGDDGSGDDGSGDDGSGDDGSGDDGGGDDGGGDDGSGDPDIVLKSVTDSFNQEGETSKVDILWVVDNSGSMSDEQENLATNFGAFIQDFVTKDVDFQMAVTTTDRMNTAINQDDIDDMAKLTRAAMLDDSAQFVQDFENLIQVGITGSGNERGLKSSNVYTDTYKNHFLRDDAYLVVVYVSDEEDQSAGTVASLLAELQSHKTNSGLVRAYSIVDMDGPKSGGSGGYFRGYERYEEMSTLTNGYVANLYDDFSSVLSNMGESIANLSEQFPLSEVPHDIGSLVVKVNGVVSSELDYIAATNTIKFRAGSVPPSNSTVEITYDVEE